MIGIIAGSFDIIHPGYVRMFKEAKDSCKHLIVALQGDPTIDRPEKCKPVQSVEDRIEILSSIKYVDSIIVYNTENELLELLKEAKYDYRVLGTDYKEKNYTGKELNKQVLWISRNHNYSTTDIKEKIYKERKNYHFLKNSIIYNS